MEYICHHNYRQKGISSNSKLFIKKGKKLFSWGDFIITKDFQIVCTKTSQNAYQHFSRNDDNYGYERGRLTYQIAFAPRRPNKESSYRFTKEEIEMITKDYPQFLTEGTDFLIFNYNFFNADIKKLRELFKKLNH